MTIEATTDVIIETLKPICVFLGGMAVEAIRRWISASKKDKDEFINVSSDAVEDGRITLHEGLMIYKEGKDVFIGVDMALIDDTQSDMGKA